LSEPWKFTVPTILLFRVKNLDSVFRHFEFKICYRYASTIEG
jgi:hypothetical protein